MQNHFQKPQPLVSPEQRLPGVPPSLREFVAESVASIRNSRWQTVKPSSYVASRAKHVNQNKPRQDLYGHSFTAHSTDQQSPTEREYGEEGNTSDDADNNSIAKRVMQSILPSGGWKRPW